MSEKKKVLVGNRPGILHRFIIKGPKKTYGLVEFEDGTIEEVFHKKLKYK